ncbi:hypothetical protein EYC80_006088 [Monilinia laxa]|uniref:Uncharacterized protein n=1 Tax=Monilinia laxa TaxID=61186 RepID=A0A5N6KGE1_MONLA|nr:hypothetical protein EYC80_006088 [Monilinia laxa]
MIRINIFVTMMMKSQRVLFEYDSSFSSLQTLPSPGFSGLLARTGWKSEISVRHTLLVFNGRDKGISEP